MCDHRDARRIPTPELSVMSIYGIYNGVDCVIRFTLQFCVPIGSDRIVHFYNIMFNPIRNKLNWCGISPNLIAIIVIYAFYA